MAESKIDVAAFVKAYQDLANLGTPYKVAGRSIPYILAVAESTYQNPLYFDLVVTYLKDVTATVTQLVANDAMNPGYSHKVERIHEILYDILGHERVDRMRWVCIPVVPFKNLNLTQLDFVMLLDDLFEAGLIPSPDFDLTSFNILTLAKL